MIHRLDIHNFKCFRNQAIDLAEMTLLSGLNGMGKSTVIQAFLLLRQSNIDGTINGLRLNGDLVGLGTASDALYEDADTEQIDFSLDIDTPILTPIDKIEMVRSVYNWGFKFDRDADVLRLVDEIPKSDSVNVGMQRTALFGVNFQYLNAERIGPRTSFGTSDHNVRQLGQIGNRGEYATQYLAMYGNRDIQNHAAQHPNAASFSLANQVEAWLGEISPGTRLNLTSVPDMDVVGLRFSFTKGRDESKPYRATNVGFGLTYTLPILVAALAMPPGGLLLIENPEAHLHPRGQAMIGNLLSRVAQGGVQVIIETHSDHILNGIRLAVHGGGEPSLLDAGKVRLHFFQRLLRANRETGELEASHTVTSPMMNRDGRISQWPEGFFDEWDKSLEALLEPRSE